MRKTMYSLFDIIPYETLRDILKQVYNVTNMRTVVSNYKGELLEGFEVEGEYNPCKEVRVGELGNWCDRSDAFAGLEAARLGRPIIYLCHRGAAEACSPIIVNGQYFGSILAGQSVLPEHEMAQLEQYIHSDRLLTSEEQCVCDKLPSMLVNNTRKRMEAVAQLLFIITNYIAEIGHRNITQRQMDEYEINLLKERTINADLERNIATVKLSNMQAQMKPHFLFNALNIINQTAMLEGAAETPKLIYALSDIMRRTLKINDGQNTLEEEIGQIKNYLYIAEVSLQDRLTVEWDVDEACLDAELPAFTLQPLVENAICHGLEQLDKGGTLRFIVKKRHGIVNITISDTGVGMNAETLQSILLLKVNGASYDKSFCSIGINNAMRILSDYFGPVFSWALESAPGQGTLFSLRIPYRPVIYD